MNCAVCQRPLHDGATACIVCGAPVAPPQPAPGMPDFAPRAPPMPIMDAYAPGPPAYAPQPGPSPLYGPGVPPPPPIAPYPPHFYAPPMSRTDPSNHMATVGFICGLLGLFPFWVGFILCIVAIVCSGFGLQHSGRLPGQRGRGLAIAGLVLGIVFIVPAGCGL